MSSSILLAYLATCVILAVTPGPNMSLIIANTTSRGLAAGLWTLAGTTTGLSILVAAAAIGMSTVMVFMAAWFDAIRWLGAIYLAVLGLLLLRDTWRMNTAPAAAPRPRRAAGYYAQGVLVSLSNPKVVLFLGAFLPQFIDPTRPLAFQLAVLAVLFVVILAAVDIAYTVAIGRLVKRLTPQWMRWMNGLSGGLLLAGGIVLATLRKP